MEQKFYPDTVHIVLKNMELDVQIGLHAHEQGRSQRILVNIALQARTSTYLKNITPENIIDYDTVYKALKTWSARPHVLLIETYIPELLEICFADPRVEAAQVSITKPDIFSDVEQAGLEVSMTRAEFENF